MEQSLHNNRVCPTNPFIKFEKEEIEQSIPERFEKQVVMYPDRLAVKDQNSQLTYDQLNQTANRVARAILAQRGEAEEPIALLLEHGVPAVVGILGVLKAGKIYAPLDPSYPRARLAYILEDSQAGLIVTNNQNFSFTGELIQHDSQLVNLDELNPNLSTMNPSLFISPDTFAYILYTSGSTGQPKGVVENHRNLLHDIRILTNAYHICPNDRISLLHSFSFSASVRKMFPALLNGAIIYPLDIKKEGMDKLANWLIQEEITVHGSRTVFREFVNILTGEEKFPKLRLITFGGASIYKKDIELCRRIFSPDSILVIGLASTEAGTITKHFIDKNTQITRNIVPVGYAVDGVDVLLLNDDGKEVGFNQVGEIAVKSRYLFPGYWRRPDLTQAKFLSAPKGGERIYLTGDMGLMLPDGCLLHMGRKDFQVKIRGYRIEIAEIESALLNLEAIKGAFVEAQENKFGDQRLVAYITLKGKETLTVTELRSFLAESLPDYMIPSTFVLLDSLPLTPTGKIDRRALPEPGTARPILETPFVAPRTPVEEIWKEILHLNEVGIHDNFLELGGHSLMATQIISRVIRTFQVEVSVKSLFESPTVADMALAITQKQVEKVDEEEIERMLDELEALSDEEARRLLADESVKMQRRK